MENVNYIFRIHPDNENVNEYVKILNAHGAKYVISKNTFKNFVEFWTIKDKGTTLIDAKDDFEKFEKNVEYVVKNDSRETIEDFDFDFVDKIVDWKRAKKGSQEKERQEESHKKDNEIYIFKIHPENEDAKEYAEILEECDAQYVITESTSLNAIEFYVGYDQQAKYFDVESKMLEDIANQVVVDAAYSERLEQFKDNIDDIIFAGGGERKPKGLFK